jgi:hypothetical protein
LPALFELLISNVAIVTKGIIAARALASKDSSELAPMPITVLSGFLGIRYYSTQLTHFVFSVTRKSFRHRKNYIFGESLEEQSWN